MKTDDSYISIRTSWGPPPPKAPKKNAAELEIENIENEVRKKRRLENQQAGVEIEIKDRESQNVDPDIDNRDWEQLIKSHGEKLEKETVEKEGKIEKIEIEEQSWALYRECKDYLERNEKNWEKARIDRELEEKKRERLSIARAKQEQMREKVKIRQLEKEIEKGIEKLPTKDRNKIEADEERKREIEIKETRKNLWKWRNKEKKIEIRNKHVEKIEKVQKIEERLLVINNILKEMQEEKEKKRLKEREEQNKKVAEWRRKVREKDRKETEKKEKLELERKIANSWTMMSWVTKFIQDNIEKWSKDRESKVREANRELENWRKLKRLEKVKHLQAKWKVEQVEKENGTSKISPQKIETQWTEWRENEKEKNVENNENLKTSTIIEDVVPEQLKYNAQNLIKNKNKVNRHKI